MSDDIRLERFFEDGLHDIAPSHAPDRLRTSIISETRAVRPRPRWLALIKEPPMRTNSRLAVGSPTWRVAVIMAATLLAALMLAGAAFSGAQLLAKDGPIIVDRSGAGTYTTISEAVAAAEEGDEILVRPGTYTEAVEIDKTITLRGDGPVEDIVIAAPEDGPRSALAGRPYALLLVESNAQVSALTLRGQPSQLHIDGGTPGLSGMILDGTGDVYAGDSSPMPHDSVYFGNGTKAELRDSEVIASGSIAIHGFSEPVIVDNILRDGTNIYVKAPGAGALITGNSITDSASRAIGIWGPGPFTIRGNTIERANGEGIGVNSASIAHIEGNTIRDSQSGISISGSDPTVTANVITDNDTVGIISFGGDGVIDDNAVSGNSSGILISGGSPVVSGNTACDNGMNITISNGATPDVDDTNDFCWDQTLTAVIADYEERLQPILQADAAAGDDSTARGVVYLDQADWADELAVAVEELDLPSRYQAEVDEFVTAHHAYAESMRARSDSPSLGSLREASFEALALRQETLKALETAVAPATE